MSDDDSFSEDLSPLRESFANQNNFRSFDDSHHAATYLQMFQSNQPKRFDLTFSADRRTTTPGRVILQQNRMQETERADIFSPVPDPQHDEAILQSPLLEEPTLPATYEEEEPAREDVAPAIQSPPPGILYDDEGIALDRQWLEDYTDDTCTSSSSSPESNTTYSSSPDQSRVYRNPYLQHQSTRRQSADVSIATSSSSQQLFGESIVQSVSTRSILSSSLRSVFSFHGDLEYLQRQHESKMRQYRGSPNTGNFDVCLILTPQQVYGFWSELLDFRAELLGPEVLEAMEQNWNEKKHLSSPAVSTATTPSTNMRRRRGTSLTSPSLRASTRTEIPQTATSNASSVFEKAMEGPAVQQTPFRKWGHQPNSLSMQSPPVRSLYSSKLTPARTVQYHDTEFPNPAIARGIAARENRTNGMMPLLYGLRRGIVLRRHSPNAPVGFCRLFSTDGGDTILYETMEPQEAFRWLDQQGEYPSEWKRQSMVRTVPFSQRKSLKVADIAAVHPARNNDVTGQPGSITLRKATSTFDPERTFSLVARHHRSTDCEWRPSKVAQFRYFDLEAANLPTYWKVFRGFLLLHRDAAVGRFAKQRTAGLGRRVADAILHEDEFHEPATGSWLERRLVQYYGLDDTYLKGFVTKATAVPPPSDYFLGFKSPGTAIWSRLRQAGLETRRVYSLDPNRVMIQVRCPSDRLMDVAEVLKVQLKTVDGRFVPFRESLTHEFIQSDDSDDSPFRSSIRQTIIDFIIGSRIRDSGAELGQRTDLGSLIQARVPLHSHAHLQSIFQAWFYFWRAEHWNEIQSHKSNYSLRRAKTDKLFIPDGGVVEDVVDEPPPHFLKRFFVGCLCQPLDAIEQYFGEKVAFYFTWLQHTAVHLVFLAVPGLIVFICMVCTGNFNHPLRPFFAVYVMMWTFIVLLNWKKRANYMAYRWGTMNYKEQETTLPQFKGVFVQDEITGEWIVRYPKWKRWLKYCISFPLTLLFTSGTLFLILWVHANRDLALAKFLTSDEVGKFKDFVPSAIGSKPVLDVKITRELLLTPQFWIIAVALPSMLGLFLPLLNFILMRLSILLNDFENYRTITEYRTFLIIKVFSFRFVCYFATLYYYAYISTIMTAEERAMEGADELRAARIQNGILRVGTGVCVFCTVAQWWQTAIQHCFPLLIRRLRMNHRLQRLADELRAVESEEEEIQRLAKSSDDASLKQRRIRSINKRLLLDQAQDETWLELMNPMHDSFPEYIQAVVQFAFVSCFSVVLPITPLLVLFNYLISMRLDAYKLCKSRRRPLAEKTGGIGVWEHVLHIVAVISVLTNCWLVGFTSSFFVAIGKKIGDLGLFALIVAWEHIMLLIKYAMSANASTIPKAVCDDMKRQQYEMEKKRSTLMLERRVKSPRISTSDV